MWQPGPVMEVLDNIGVSDSKKWPIEVLETGVSTNCVQTSGRTYQGLIQPLPGVNNFLCKWLLGLELLLDVVGTGESILLCKVAVIRV